MQGAVSDQETGRRSSRVQVYGVDDRFWRFHGVDGSGPATRDVFVSRALAAEIGAIVGHSVLIRVERPSDIPIESLHGRKDAVGRAMRLTVRSVIDAPAMGDFSLQPQQGDVRAIFVPLARLQTDLGVANRVHALLVADAPTATRAASDKTTTLNAAIRRRFALEDVGVSVRSSGTGELIADGAAGLIDAPRTRAIEGAAVAAGLKP